MKTVKFTVMVVLFAGFLLSTASCGAEKYATEKRNLMLISKAEMPANKKYTETSKRKTNKVKTKKAKRKSLF